MTTLDGRRRIGEGAEAEIYEWDDGLVLRLMRSPDAEPSIARATLASEAARTSGVPTPKVIEVLEVEGRPGQVMERVDGQDMLAEIEERPQRIVATARNLARIHTELLAVDAPPELETMHAMAARRLATSTQVPDDVKDQALSVLEDLPRGAALCHGDFHPGNVLLTENGPVLIDWSSAACGDPISDFARTRLLIQVGTLPPGTSMMLRTVAGVGRRVLVRFYVNGFRKAMPIDMAVAERWTLVCAAIRLTEIEVSSSEAQTVLQIARRQITH